MTALGLYLISRTTNHESRTTTEDEHNYTAPNQAGLAGGVGESMKARCQSSSMRSDQRR
jgi:hypothetical protein